MSNINETISEYLKAIENRSENTVKTYRQALKAFVEIVGDAELTPETYKTFLLKTKKINPATQATYRVAVMGLYLFYAAEHPEVNIAALREYNKRHAQIKGQRLPNFDREAIEKLINHCTAMRNGLLELRDRAFVLTLADTGLRISEACGLYRGDIDWQKALAVVIGKGDKEAIVRFSFRSLEAIKDYLSARAEIDGKMGKPLASLPLFARHDKGAGKKLKPVQAHGMWHAVKERAKEAGIDPKRIRVHGLRHYFVTRVQEVGGDIYLTKELARHSDISVTTRYAHTDKKANDLYNQVFNKDR